MQDGLLSWTFGNIRLHATRPTHPGLCLFVVLRILYASVVRTLVFSSGGPLYPSFVLAPREGIQADSVSQTRCTIPPSIYGGAFITRETSSRATRLSNFEIKNRYPGHTSRLCL